MKRLKFFGWTLFTLVTSLFLFVQCTHEDAVTPPPPPPEIGDAIVSASDGWNFDKAHSSVRWETLYFNGAGALLTGRFNNFGIDLTFDEATPSNINIKAFVVLSTVNTGEPGRDGGCLQGTFGTATADTAWFQSKSAEYVEGTTDIEVYGDLTFHGVTSEVMMTLLFRGEHEYGTEVRGGPLKLAGFSGEFPLNAKTIFGIESDNIEDIVTVKVNAQYKKPL